MNRAKRLAWVAPSAAGVRLLVQQANAAERLEAVRRRRAELAQLRRVAEEHARHNRMLRLTLEGERARLGLAIEERDKRIEWLEARLDEYARAVRPC